MTARSPYDTLITVYGGSGFLGRHVVRALAKRHYRIRVAVRRPELANFLQPLGRVGQIHAVQANLRNAPSVEAAARDARVLINLVGVLSSAAASGSTRSMLTGPSRWRWSNAHGARMVHVSAIGADANSSSAYARTKANARTVGAGGTAIDRDHAAFDPVRARGRFLQPLCCARADVTGIASIGGGLTRFQPAFVGDVAAAIADAVDGKARAGTVYELGGPDIRTFKELMQFVLATIERKRLLVSLPFSVAKLQAMLLQYPEAVAQSRSGRAAPRRNVVSEPQIGDANVSGPRHRTSTRLKRSSRLISGAFVEPGQLRNASLSPTYKAEVRRWPPGCATMRTAQSCDVHVTEKRLHNDPPKINENKNPTTVTAILPPSASSPRLL